MQQRSRVLIERGILICVQAEYEIKYMPSSWKYALHEAVEWVNQKLEWNCKGCK